MALVWFEQFKNRFVYNALFIVAVVFAQPAMAVQVEFEFGGGLMKFDYAEYNGSAVFLDGETGFIPGGVLKLKLNSQSVYSEFVGQLYGNTIQYDGQTQGGTPVQTDSDAVIFDTHYKFGFKLSQARNHGPYLGLGYRYWFRNIRSGYDINGNPVAGLLEEYYWNYGLLGYSGSFRASEKMRVGFDIRHTKMFNAKMDVDFLGFGGYDDAQVNLGEEFGSRISVPVKMIMRGYSLIVSPYYERIDIGKSNTVRLTSGGVPTTTLILEPRSETRNVGIEITWLW